MRPDRSSSLQSVPKHPLHLPNPLEEKTTGLRKRTTQIDRETEASPPTGVLPPSASSDSNDTIVDDLLEKLVEKSRYRKLLKETGKYAQGRLNKFQEILEKSAPRTIEWGSIIVAMERLSTRTSLLPDLYRLRDVERLSERALSEGGFAEIFQGRYEQRVVCIKMIKKYQNSDPRVVTKAFARETIVWKQLSHKNVLPFFGVCEINDRPCLVSPWMENGNVVEYLELNPGADRLKLVIDVTMGLEYLHEHNIVHGDLKGVNILITKDEIACLADFGISSISDPSILSWTTQSSAVSRGGSYRWMAPELFVGDSRNTKESDVYSWGCTCYEIFTGQVPFAEIKKSANVILPKHQGISPTRPAEGHPAWTQWGLSSTLWSLISLCWKTHPTHRPTLTDVVRQLDQLSKEDNYIQVAHNIKISRRIDIRTSVIEGHEPPSIPTTYLFFFFLHALRGALNVNQDHLT